MAKSTEPIKAKPKKRRQAPGVTIQARENQIISLAFDLVEDRIKKGTATSQEVTQFIKLGSSVAQLEKIKLENENKLLIARTESIASQKKVEELYEKAIKQMAIYQGRDDEQ